MPENPYRNRETVLQMRRDGYTNPEIKARTGYDQKTISTYCRRAGLAVSKNAAGRRSKRMAADAGRRFVVDYRKCG